MDKANVGWVEARNPTQHNTHMAVETTSTQTKPACAGFK